ncbi:MAG: TIGR00180 family glycosyltransferase, partial [Acidimicrobiaceae bacterium]
MDRVSIVIPSINHPMLLERSIEYWRKIHVQVHILDGSNRPLFDIEDFKDLRISYHHQPWGDEDSYSNFCNLMSLGTKLISTEFAAICGDDDFFTVSGLLKSINSLSSDSNVDAITGRTAYYLEGSSEIRWSVKGLSRIDTPKMRSDDMFERMNSGAPWAMYAICRTRLWKELFDISFSERLEHKDAHELLVRELSRVMMRSKVIDDLVSVRQFTIPGSNLPEVVSLSDWLKSELILNSCDAIRSRLSRGVDSALIVNQFVNSSEIVDSIISRYLPAARKENAVAVKSNWSLTATFKQFF